LKLLNIETIELINYRTNIAFFSCNVFGSTEQEEEKKT